MLPPDRGHLPTEQHHHGEAIDALPLDAMIAALIADQGDATAAVAAAAPRLNAFVEALAPRIARGGRLIYLGAGTSGRLGVLDASECPPTFAVDPAVVVGLIAGGDPALRRSSEAREDDPDGAHPLLDELGVGEDDTVMGIAAGGTTPWVLGGVRFASRRGAMTALLTCVPQQEVIVDHAIQLATGPERLSGSTRLKAGTATKITLNVITTSLFVTLGKVYRNRMVDLRATNDKLHDRALRILADLCPGIDREQAGRLLREADGQVKIALVMHHLALGYEAARTALGTAEGSLRRLLHPGERTTPASPSTLHKDAPHET